ncbi:hypothetical protein BHE74_00021589 [Ensete ventricosum]|nr:hypothetical protein BHE74_00021589 [Ensete ventricosum]
MGAGCQDGWRVRSSTALIWASTSGGRGRWTSVRDHSVKEKQQIWFGIARLAAQAATEAGFSWPRLSPGRIRHCGYCHRRSTLTRPLAIESPVDFFDSIAGANQALPEEYVSGFHRCEKEKKKKCNDRKLADREGRSATMADG